MLHPPMRCLVDRTARQVASSVGEIACNTAPKIDHEAKNGRFTWVSLWCVGLRGRLGVKVLSRMLAWAKHAMPDA